MKHVLCDALFPCLLTAFIIRDVFFPDLVARGTKQPRIFVESLISWFLITSFIHTNFACAGHIRSRQVFVFCSLFSRLSPKHGLCLSFFFMLIRVGSKGSIRKMFLINVLICLPSWHFYSTFYCFILQTFFSLFYALWREKIAQSLQTSKQAKTIANNCSDPIISETMLIISSN